MRRLQPSTSSFLRWKSYILDHTSRHSLHPFLLAEASIPILYQTNPSRHLAQVRSEPLHELWFSSNHPRPLRSPADDLLNHTTTRNGNGGHKPPEERTLKLGATLRKLSPLLPEILIKPLPTEILSPSVSLHLFPSTHPHLPAVKGRVPYKAALWTAPVAWGSVPLVGNVRLRIVSEKIVRTGFIQTPHLEDQANLGEEKLVVRWKTEPKKTGSGHNGNSDSNLAAASSAPAGQNGGINRGLSKLLGGDAPLFSLSKGDEFSGMFIFSFDKEGRIATHTIEHADESNGYDKTSKMVTLTDWLLGKAKWGRGREAELVPGLAIKVCRDEWIRGGSRSVREQLRERRGF